eukprot:CAMPEP_0117874168 /NCGR_PEP_ID=MMETSP0950-20121206/12179_1 /TAXON_ID=44440 /ORGANISM="Chattonella subsalsa, Strain CCMP2191" /LENGTH=52 /DNA_ID=CAMNT_0005727403 /DNA_START=409 /DNA_END=567 /DNA_ORIENTATION=+
MALGHSVSGVSVELEGWMVGTSSEGLLFVGLSVTGIYEEVGLGVVEEARHWE